MSDSLLLKKTYFTSASSAVSLFFLCNSLVQFQPYYLISAASFAVTYFQAQRVRNRRDQFYYFAGVFFAVHTRDATKFVSPNNYWMAALSFSLGACILSGQVLAHHFCNLDGTLTYDTKVALRRRWSVLALWLNLKGEVQDELYRKYISAQLSFKKVNQGYASLYSALISYSGVDGDSFRECIADHIAGKISAMVEDEMDAGLEPYLNQLKAGVIPVDDLQIESMEEIFQKPIVIVSAQGGLITTRNLKRYGENAPIFVYQGNYAGKTYYEELQLNAGNDNLLAIIAQIQNNQKQAIPAQYELITQRDYLMRNRGVAFSEKYVFADDYHFCPKRIDYRISPIARFIANNKSFVAAKAVLLLASTLCFYSLAVQSSAPPGLYLTACYGIAAQQAFRTTSLPESVYSLFSLAVAQLIQTASLENAGHLGGEGLLACLGFSMLQYGLPRLQDRPAGRANHTMPKLAGSPGYR